MCAVQKQIKKDVAVVVVVIAMFGAVQKSNIQVQTKRIQTRNVKALNVKIHFILANGNKHHFPIRYWFDTAIRKYRMYAKHILVNFVWSFFLFYFQ